VRIGVRYCGGCRASFDRSAEADLACEASGIVLEYAVPGDSYDVLLALCGCRSQCVDLSPYKSDRIIYINEKGGGAKAAEAIEAAMEVRNV